MQNGHHFVVAMDNYFTLPKVMGMLRDIGVGCVGTARAKRGWPPKELQVPDTPSFNDLYWCTDDTGTLIVRWIDNSSVLMVTTVHKVTQKVSRVRKKPRQTATNRNHIQQVWGVNAAVSIEIPRIVDDYNHWMG